VWYFIGTDPRSPSTVRSAAQRRGAFRHLTGDEIGEGGRLLECVDQLAQLVRERFALGGVHHDCVQRVERQLATFSPCVIARRLRDEQQLRRVNAHDAHGASCCCRRAVV
jgi:hypothetical protein